MKNLRYGILALLVLITTVFAQWYDFIGQLQFDPNSSNPPYSEGMMFYDNTENAVAFYTDDPDLEVHLGRDIILRARNTHGSNLIDGDLVYITGSTGQVVNVVKAQANFIEDSRLIGVWVSGTTANNGFGYVLTSGTVHNIDTSSLSEGDEVYLSDVTAGTFIATKPVSPNIIVNIGVVTNSHATQGSINLHIRREPRNEYVTRNILSNNIGDAQEVSDVTTALSDTFLTGDSAVFAASGTLSGTLITSTTGADLLDGTRVFKYTQAAGSLNDWISTPSMVVPEIVNTVAVSLGYSFRYKYDGDNGDIEVRALCVDDSSILLGVSDDSVSLLKDVYKATGIISVPKDCNAIKLGFKVVTLNSGKILLFDNIQISDDPFVYKNMMITQILRYDGFSSRNGSGFVKFLTRQYNKNGLGEDVSLLFTDDNTDHTRITALRSVIFHVSVGYEATIAHSSRIRRYNSAGVLQETNKIEQNTGFHTTNPSGTFPMDTGDYIVVHANNNSSNDTETAWIQVFATAESEHVVFATEKREEWIDGGEITIEATTTDPTKGTTSVDKLMWRRIGDSMEIRIAYTQTGGGGGGSGDYKIKMPAGYEIDLTDIVAYATVEGSNTGYKLKNSVGTNFISNGTSDAGVGAVVVFDKDYFRFAHVYNTAAGGGNIGYWGSGHDSLNISAVEIHAIITVPILGWTGTSNQFVVIPTAGSEVVIGKFAKIRVAYVSHVEATGVDGGAATSGSWLQRTLNTLEGDTEFISLSSNRFTLQAGKYLIEGFGQFFNAVDRCQVKLVKDPAGTPTDAIIGSSGNISVSGAPVNSLISGVLDITVSTTYEIQYQVATTIATNGLGFGSDFGDNLYAKLKITQILAR